MITTSTMEELSLVYLDFEFATYHAFGFSRVASKQDNHDLFVNMSRESEGGHSLNVRMRNKVCQANAFSNLTPNSLNSFIFLSELNT